MHRVRWREAGAIASIRIRVRLSLGLDHIVVDQATVNNSSNSGRTVNGSR